MRIRKKNLFHILILLMELCDYLIKKTEVRIANVNGKK